MVEDLKVDICVFSETWFDEDSSSNLMQKHIGSDFVWFGRERKGQKGRSGSLGFMQKIGWDLFSSKM